MVVLVSIGVISVAVAGVIVGKWLKRISERYEQQNDERLAKFKEISDNLTSYVNGKKSENGSTDD